MTTIIVDTSAEAEYIADRRAKGLDRFDEVWDGVYIMSPLANNEQQKLALRLAAAMDVVVDLELGGLSYCGCNVSDQDQDWKFNYRCPDVAVFLAETAATDRGSHWQGGPDFAIEITSRGDKTWDKLEFYAKVGTQELLVVEREPWEMILVRSAGSALKEVGRATLTNNTVLQSKVVPFNFRLTTKNQRPTIEVQHQVDGRTWFAQGGVG